MNHSLHPEHRSFANRAQARKVKSLSIQRFALTMLCVGFTSLSLFGQTCYTSAQLGGCETMEFSLNGGPLVGFIYEQGDCGDCWASDVFVIVEDQSGTCVFYEGYNNCGTTAPEGCAYQGAWGPDAGGDYSGESDLTGLLNGDDVWDFTVTNSYTGGYTPAYTFYTDPDGVDNCTTVAPTGDCDDVDTDDICDDVDDCVGAYDDCGVCNGPGEIYACGCSDIPAGDCDCNGNQLDALGVCGGSCGADINANGLCDDSEISGCTDPTGCNYDPTATLSDGTCDYSCCPGPGCCHDGTVWNLEFQQCVIQDPAFLNDPGEIAELNPCYYDTDENGIVDVNDMLNLLSVFGSSCE